MDLFSRDDLTELLEAPATDCVSLYLPAHRAGPDTQQQRIRLTKLIHHAEAELVRRGMRRRDADRLLAPARQLADDVMFWHRTDGLAAFLRAGWWRVYRLPLAVDDLAAVANRFHVLPLLPLLTGDGRYFVLALSENEATLYAGTRKGLHAIPVHGLPHGVDDALRFDELQPQRGHHFGVRAGLKVRPVLHGQGIGREIQNERLGRYLREVDHAVSAVLRGERAPLVLAGVDRIRAAYRHLTAYRWEVAQGVAGNPDHLTAAELHARAWPLAADVFARARDGAVATVRRELGTGLAVAELAEIVPAAETGRVELLLLRDESPVSEREQVESAAVHTIRAGGTVFVVPAADMPGTGPAAAVLRA